MRSALPICFSTILATLLAGVVSSLARGDEPVLVLTAPDARAILGCKTSNHPCASA